MTEATEERCTSWIVQGCNHRKCGRLAKVDGLCGRHMAHRVDEAEARRGADYARRLKEDADAETDDLWDHVHGDACESCIPSHATAAGVVVGWSVAEAAAVLDPPMSESKVRALIWLLGIPACGTVASAGRGRPAARYPADAIMEAHAAVIRSRDAAVMLRNETGAWRRAQ